MKVLAVDPGVKATGLAFFDDYNLVGVTLARARSLELMIQALESARPVEMGVPEIVIIERPVVYRRGGKGDPADLISVAIVAGAAACTFGRGTWTETKFVEPRTWKGSVPKNIHNERIIDRLDDEERKILKDRLVKAPVKLIHNVIDAVGIGLYQLGRI